MRFHDRFYIKFDIKTSDFWGKNQLWQTDPYKKSLQNVHINANLNLDGFKYLIRIEFTIQLCIYLLWAEAGFRYLTRIVKVYEDLGI